MQLRLRYLETKETLKLEIPSPCTLQQLQQTLSQSISLQPSSSLYFSLNKKDTLHASSPNDSLHSLGITTGDLIYFSLNPTTFSLNVQKEETEDTQDLSGAETMDFDDDGSVDVAVDKRFSETYFLRRVLRDILGDDGSTHNKLLVIAVHTVLLESGFIGFDSVTGLRVDKFHLPDDAECCTGFGVRLCYTLPELWGNVNESVVLKFQSSGHFVNVYGSLSKGGSSLYQVCLDQFRFAPTIDLVEANCNNGSLNSYLENEVLEFWKIVKDGLALPLLIDLCDKTGLNLPACFMGMPTEIKVKILESLFGVDVANMGCVCSEMRYLSSNDDLWKQKFAEEFDDVTTAPLMIHWKNRFAYSWRKRVIAPIYFPSPPIYVPRAPIYDPSPPIYE